MQQIFYRANIPSSKLDSKSNIKSPLLKIEKMGGAIKLFFRKLYQPVGFSKGYNFILCQCSNFKSISS